MVVEAEKYLAEISEILDNSDLHKFDKEWIKIKINIVALLYAKNSYDKVLKDRGLK